mmetsp:Transcript_14749/g.28031  ORF Transcript_14749/g.28031 Transcript_14749/m.28031 type:complete len:246 (-) Transcript_14749:61-798(-)
MSLQGSWRNPFGEGALNNLIFFVVEESASFNCDAVGSRCSFLRSDWGDIDEDGGAIADQIEGAVWTVAQNTTTPLDTLNLNSCQFDTCIPACFNDCTCVDAAGESCPTTTAPPSAAPTQAPDATPVVKDCPVKINDDKCPEVALSANLRAGQVCDYCYNFCNGKFLGCCEEDGSCSAAQCTEDPETGLKEEVFGCPEIFSSSTSPIIDGPGDTSDEPTPSAAAMSVQSRMLVAMVAVLFVAREFN